MHRRERGNSGRFDLSGSGSVRLVEHADDVFDSFAYAGEQLCPIEVVDICWPVRLELSEGGEDQLSFSALNAADPDGSALAVHLAGGDG